MFADQSSPLERPVIGVGVLVWREKQLLLGERIVKGRNSCWQFPGGFIEAGESVTGCARREVLEETAIKVKNLRHFGFTDKVFDGVKHKVITLFISCEYLSGEAVVLEPEKCAGWKWVDYDSLPTPLFEPTENFLSQLSVSQVNVTPALDDLYAMHCVAPVLADALSGEHR